MIAKLFSTSGSATDNTLKQTLYVVRDAIELYVAENDGQLPPCTTTGADFRTALDKFIRGNDLVVTYTETKKRPFSLQVYWRATTSEQSVLLLDVILPGP